MRVYILINNEKLELEDAFSLQDQEPIINKSFFVQIEGEKKTYTVRKIDVILIKSGKSLDVVKEITLE